MMRIHLCLQEVKQLETIVSNIKVLQI